MPGQSTEAFRSRDERAFIRPKTNPAMLDELIHDGPGSVPAEKVGNGCPGIASSAHEHTGPIVTIELTSSSDWRSSDQVALP